ncbi:hypothetical protein [Geminisphaera colitermitum]|uniref:hypothetical protein n=1 Tax=Geminisphaera colitermitum TaxID=1148786 RepID=UPI0012FEE6E3|nr:hypothetical protein [Geminisphaera colitermitum]
MRPNVAAHIEPGDSNIGGGGGEGRAGLLTRQTARSAAIPDVRGCAASGGSGDPPSDARLPKIESPCAPDSVPCLRFDS